MENTENIEIQNSSSLENSPEAIYQEIKDGKVDFFSLPRNERIKVEKEVIQNLSEKEKEAYSQGWSPKEFFKGLDKFGNPKEWVDADQFLEKIEKIAPVKNERIREIAKERDSIRGENEELKIQLKKLLEINKAKLERDLINDEQVIKREMEEAEEIGDVKKFKEVQERKNYVDREKLRLKNFEDAPSPPKFNPPTPQELSAEVSEWAARNPEIVNDAVMLNYAKQLDNALALDPDTKDLSLSERLRLVEDRTKTKFAANFPNRKAPIDSSRNSANFGAKPKQQNFNDLSSEDKRQANYLIRKGVYKNEADYMKFMNSIK